MVASLPKKFERFANWSGAKIPKKAQTEIELEMPEFIPEPESQAVEPPTDDLIQTKFQRNDKPWKNPKVTLGATLVIAAAVTGIGFAAFNSNMPNLGGAALGSAKAGNSNDDAEPTTHADGSVQTAAIAGNLGEGIDKDANAAPSNPFTTTQKDTAGQAIPTKAAAKVPGGSVPGEASPGHLPSPSKAVANTPVYPTTAAPAATTVPMTRRTLSNPTYTDYNSSPTPRTYPRPSSVASTPSVGYSPGSVPGEASPGHLPRRPVASSSPAVHSSPAYPTVNPSVAVAAAPQLSATDRRAAAVASTSSMGGTSEKAGVQATSVAAVPAPQAQTYQEAVYLPSEDAVLNGIPQQVFSRSQKALGRLLLGVAFLPGDTAALNGQPVEVAIENPLQSGLPVGARIGAIVEFPEAGGQLKSAVIRLTPKTIVIGDAEYPLPAGTVILTGKNGQPLIATRQGSAFLRTIGSAAKTVVSGAVGGLTTSLLGNGGGLLSSLGGLLGGGRNTTTQQATEVLALRENTAIQVNIVRPLTLPIQADAAIDPTSTHAAVPQPMMFTQDITDAQLMAIANEPLDSTQPVQLTGLSQSEVQDAQ